VRVGRKVLQVERAKATTYQANWDVVPPVVIGNTGSLHFDQMRSGDGNYRAKYQTCNVSLLGSISDDLVLVRISIGTTYTIVILRR
jgi:hypothetical protein